MCEYMNKCVPFQFLMASKLLGGLETSSGTLMESNFSLQSLSYIDSGIKYNYKTNALCMYLFSDGALLARV